MVHLSAVYNKVCEPRKSLQQKLQEGSSLDLTDMHVLSSNAIWVWNFKITR